MTPIVNFFVAVVFNRLICLVIWLQPIWHLYQTYLVCSIDRLLTTVSSYVEVLIVAQTCLHLTLLGFRSDMSEYFSPSFLKNKRKGDVSMAVYHKEYYQEYHRVLIKNYTIVLQIFARAFLYYHLIWYKSLPINNSNNKGIIFGHLELIFDISSIESVIIWYGLHRWWLYYEWKWLACVQLTQKVYEGYLLWGISLVHSFKGSNK